MTDEEIAVKLAEHNTEIGSLKHRVDDLEDLNKVIQDIALSVQKLAMNIQNMVDEQERARLVQEKVFERIEVLEGRPIRKYETVAKTILTALISGMMGYLINALG